MNNYSFPSVGFSRLPSNQRNHKHCRKKTIRNCKRKTYADGKSDEYLLLMSDEESEDEIFLNDLSHIRNRQKNSSNNYSSLENAKIRKHSFSDPFLNCDFVTLELQKNDTLQRISVKYGCSISNLKRANNIISNQEFYGLRHLKIPVKKYSLLTEVLPTNNCEAPKDRGDNKICDDYKTVNIGIGPMLANNSSDDAAAFLKRMDEDLMKIMLNTQSQKGSLEEVTAALSESRIHPLVKDSNTEGIQWSSLLIVILLIAVIVPVCIVLYMYYWKYHHGHMPFNITKISDFVKS